MVALVVLVGMSSPSPGRPWFVTRSLPFGCGASGVGGGGAGLDVAGIGLGLGTGGLCVVELGVRSDVTSTTSSESESESDGVVGVVVCFPLRVTARAVNLMGGSSLSS